MRTVIQRTPHGIFIYRSIVLWFFIVNFCFRMAHKLRFDDDEAVLARDANTKNDDWYEVFDPRNPLNKRRREESKKALVKKTGTKR